MNNYIDITEVVKGLIVFMTALVTYFLIPWLKQKVEVEKLEKVTKWVKAAVKAAEMIYNESGMGAKKKAYVLEFLAEKGYTMDVDSIDVLIEAAVQELNTGK